MGHVPAEAGENGSKRLPDNDLVSSAQLSPLCEAAVLTVAILC